MEQKADVFSQLVHQKELLRNFSKILGAGYNLDKLLEYFISTLEELLRIGRIAILLQDGEHFKIKAFKGIPIDAIQDTLFPLREGLVKYLIEEGTAIRIDFARAQSPDIVGQLKSLGVTTAVPAWEHGRLKAVVIFNNKVIGVPVSDEELELVFALASQLAIGIENSTLMDLISRQRTYLENILSNVSSAVISVDAGGNIVLYNSKAEEILGISSMEVLNKSVALLPHDISMFLMDTVKTGMPVYRKEFNISGLDKYVGASITPMRDNQGVINGAVMVFTDLAPVKALETQMRRADRLDFVNTVAMRSSHELKNCLVAIKTFAQLLPERYADKQFREDFYIVVNKEVDRLNNVVENLLFFAEPLKLACTMCNVDEMIQKTINSLEREDLLGGINVKKEYGHSEHFVFMDAEAMKKVFRHIFYNSIQAMPKGGGIRIVTGEDSIKENKMFQVRIIDEGIGIAEDGVGKIWEPFFTTKMRGIGLGLTIVKKIIDAHNGTIEIKNSGQSKGVEVLISLPVVSSKPTGVRAYFPSGREVVV